MSIKAKLIISITLSLAITTTIGFVLFQNTITLKQQIAGQTILSELQNKLFERAILRDEYLLYHEERSAVQWKILFKTVDELIRQASESPVLANQQVILKAFGDNEKTINQTFSQLVENVTNGGGNPATTNKDLEQKLIGSIFIKSQENFTLTSQLVDTTRSGVIESQNRTTIFVLVFFSISMIVILVMLYLIYFSITKPLIKLKEAAVRIASFDFSSSSSSSSSSMA